MRLDDLAEIYTKIITQQAKLHAYETALLNATITKQAVTINELNSYIKQYQQAGITVPEGSPAAIVGSEIG